MKSPLHTILASFCASLLVACGEDSASAPASQAVVYTKSDYGIAWTTVDYGVIQDSRDGQLYRTVKMGTQTWFAENLNYRIPSADSGWCFISSPDTCAKYGRLYTWSATLDGAVSSVASPSGVRGICPTGWHVPSDAEWDTLVAFVEHDPRVGLDNGGIALKSTTGWMAGTASTGSDLFGFRALPSGYRYSTGQFMSWALCGWWSSTAASEANALRRELRNNYNSVIPGLTEKKAGFSVRCVQD